MKEVSVMEKIKAVGALLEGHFVYTSGRHGNRYINKDAIYVHPRLTGELCLYLAGRFLAERPQVVVGPAMGGLILSQWVAYQLSELVHSDAMSVYAEKSADGGFVVKRGYDKIVAGKTVLVVEDVLTTGGSVKKVVEVVRAIGGEVVGVGAICNRGGVTAFDIGAPRLESLVNITLDSWASEECSFCEADIPVSMDVGKGKK
jgi:orotate phosphoribosyltransferase